jgi:hypothetical protein
MLEPLVKKNATERNAKMLAAAHIFPPCLPFPDCNGYGVAIAIAA